jgi:hypothetical protein
MARFVLRKRRQGLSVVRLLLRHLFRSFDARFTGRFIASDEEHGVTPAIRLSGNA